MIIQGMSEGEFAIFGDALEAGYHLDHRIASEDRVEAFRFAISGRPQTPYRMTITEASQDIDLTVADVVDVAPEEGHGPTVMIAGPRPASEAADGGLSAEAKVIVAEAMIEVAALHAPRDGMSVFLTKALEAVAILVQV